MADPLDTAAKLRTAYAEPYKKGAEQLQSGQTYRDTIDLKPGRAAQPARDTEFD